MHYITQVVTCVKQKLVLLVFFVRIPSCLREVKMFQTNVMETECLPTVCKSAHQSTVVTDLSGLLLFRCLIPYFTKD